MAASSSPNQTILALDVGEKRIGLAIGGSIARLPSPLETIDNGSDFDDTLREIIRRESVDRLVIGIPRNLQGQETFQSAYIRTFSMQVAKATDLPIEYVDESLSSRRADDYLSAHPTSDATRDSLAAVFILSEYFDMIDQRKLH